MTTAAALGVALVALAALLAALALVVTVARTVRLARARRRRVRAEPLRPLLLQLAAGDPEDADEALTRLAALGAPDWAAVEPVVGGLLLKVRGETHAAVVALLERRGTLDRARERTRSRSVVRRAEAAELLGATGLARATRHLLPLLEDRDPEVRQVAARALGRGGDPAAVPPLLARLSPPHEIPARVVATAVLRLGAAAHPALVEALRTGDAPQRATAAEIAGLSGALTCVPALVAALEGDAVLEVRIRAARALGRLGPREAVAPLVAAAADGEPGPLRAVAARALGEVGDPAAVPHLVALLHAGAHHVASNAARALADLGPTGRAALRTAAEPPPTDAPNADPGTAGGGETAGSADDVAVASEVAHARDALATADLRERAGAAS